MSGNTLIPSSHFYKYRIKRGDNLSKTANVFNIRLNDLKLAKKVMKSELVRYYKILNKWIRTEYYLF